MPVLSIATAVPVPIATPTSTGDDASHGTRSAGGRTITSFVTAEVDEWTCVLAALSLATDVANGHHDDKTLRACVLAVGLAEALGFERSRQREVFHATLLRYIGCSSFAHEEVALFGDDLRARQAFAVVDYGDVADRFWAGAAAIAPEAGTLRRWLTGGAAAIGPEVSRLSLYASQCEVGRRFGDRLGLDAGAIAALSQIHERWDGRGGPARLQEAQLEPVVTVLQVAHFAESILHRSGLEAAVVAVAQRRGGALAPAVCDAFTSHARGLVAPLEPEGAWAAFVAIGARFPVVQSSHRVDDVIAAFADFTDLYSVYTLGHSSQVAEVATRAAGGLALATAEIETLRRAALLHDLGRIALPCALWEKSTPLSAAERERIHLHAYWGQRLLARAPSLASEAALAEATHERCNGAGYPRRLEGTALPIAARVLAAADVWCALRSDRPHRPGFDDAAASAMLRGEARSGKLDARVVDAILGVGPRPSRARPAGLTDREIEVLQLVARGATNKEVAQRLGISARTVGHHLAHAYEKIGVSTRAAAALFAIEHGLVTIAAHVP